MSKRMVVCFVLALVAAFGTTACAGQESRLEERVEILEAEVSDLREDVEEIEFLLGLELEEEPQQEEQQPEQTQQEEKTQ